jgi:hypothetical protein
MSEEQFADAALMRSLEERYDNITLPDPVQE